MSPDRGSAAAQSAASDGTSMEAVGVLGDQSRRAMFDFVRRAGRPVTREEAAASAGISRKLAAFHLDKLVDAGLLRARYGAPDLPRRVGRQPKVYEPTGVQITVSIPERRHRLLADLLLDGVLGQPQGGSAADSSVEAARRRGRELGAGERERARPGRLGLERGLTFCEHALNQYGFEPVRDTPVQIRLTNCPFHPLAAKAPELVCGMNQAFLAGFLEGLDVPALRAVLEPRDGECCVRLLPADTPAGQPD